MRHERDEDGDCVPWCDRCAEDLKRRHEAFLGDLFELSVKHGLHIEAWARYADDSFFGIEEGVAEYELDPQTPGEIKARRLTPDELWHYKYRMRGGPSGDPGVVVLPPIEEET